MKERGLLAPRSCPGRSCSGCLCHLRRWEASLAEAYDGPQIVGMDLHRRRSVLVRMAEDGHKLSTARIANSPARLAAEIRRAGLHPQVVLEACYGWYWAADTLTAAGAEVHLAHPLGVKEFSHRRVKNDELDARDRADLLRMGRLAEAGSPRRRSASSARSPGTGRSWCTSAPAARTRSTGCWPSSASR